MSPEQSLRFLRLNDVVATLGFVWVASNGLSQTYEGMRPQRVPQSGLQAPCAELSVAIWT
jgi:hypothetical protein